MTKETIIVLVKELNGRYSNKEIYQDLEIPKTTFYRWLNSTEKNTTDVEVITEVCRKNYLRYGDRKITVTLRKLGLIINHKKVLKIMRENQVLVKVREKKNNYLIGNECNVEPNIINRQFKADKPNQKWFTDITFMYFAIAKNTCSGYS